MVECSPLCAVNKRRMNLPQRLKPRILLLSYRTPKGVLHPGTCSSIAEQSKIITAAFFLSSGLTPLSFAAGS